LLAEPTALHSAGRFIPYQPRRRKHRLRGADKRPVQQQAAGL